jgi:hypothetical protein
MRDEYLMKAMLEVAPPGHEEQVLALKGKVSNPYAVAWASYGASHKRKKKESNGSGSLASFLRRASQSAAKKDLAEKKRKRSTKESLKPEQPFKLLETIREASSDPKAPEGPVVKCILITEGLGNRNNMNYYGAEALTKGVALFEGKPCFLDHMAESEEKDRPERTVKDKCGYFKNVQLASDGGKTALMAELHFDLSESGRLAYAKAVTAIHYKDEFPDTDQEYVGLSINANGRREKRTMKIGEEMLEVNYVTEFTDVGSIDEVTTPARGGRFLATLVESAAGVIIKRKETQTMLIKSLKAALSALTESLKDEKISDESKVKLTESKESINALLKEAMKCAKEAEEESKEDEAEEAESEEGDEEGVKPGHKVTKTVVVKHDGPAEDDSEPDDDDKDSQESKRGYIKSLLKEAAIPKKLWNMEKLCKLSLKEAKAEIAEKKALIESVQEAIDEQDGFVSVGNGVDGLSESETHSQNLNSVFAGLAD